MLTVDGKGKQARDFMKRATNYVKEKFGVQVQILRRKTPRAGENARLLAMFTFDSLAAWGEYQEKAEKDDGWQKLVEDGFRSKDKCFTYNDFSRTIFEVLD
jgi:hypothetical protein